MIPALLGIGVCLAFILYSSYSIRDISFVLAFAFVFALLNVVMVHLLPPKYGVEIYGQNTVLMKVGLQNTLQELLSF